MIPRPLTGVSYFGNRFQAHAEADLAVMAESCDYVVHTLSETDLLYHKSALAKIFAATRRRNLEAWADPWGLGGVFGGEALSKYLLEHPGEWQVLSDGKRVPAACINQPGFRHFVEEWVLIARDMGAQVVFWDEPHVHFHWDLEWEGVYSCVCDACRALYRDIYGGKMPARLTEEAADFRRRSLHDFLEHVMAFSRREKLKNALCLYAYEGHKAYDAIWDDLSNLPSLDIFGCDPYWNWPPRRRTAESHVAHFTKKVVAGAKPQGRGSQIWIQAMRLAKGAEPDIAAAIQAAAQAGATHLAAWSFDGGALLDTVLAEDPVEVWATVEKAYKELREK